MIIHVMQNPPVILEPVIVIVFGGLSGFDLIDFEGDLVLEGVEGNLWKVLVQGFDETCEEGLVL